MAKKIPIGSKKHPLIQVMQQMFPGFRDEQILDTFRSRLTEREYKRLFGPDMEQRKREYDKNRPSLCDMTQSSQQYVLAITIEKCPVRCKLLKGSGGCPPEDCGGVWSFAEMLESGECEPEEFELEEGQAMVENYVDMVSSPDYRYGSLRENMFGF